MKILESYHFFITLCFHDSGDQESYVSFRKILLILVMISIFCSGGLYFTLVVVDSSKLSTCESTSKKINDLFYFCLNQKPKSKAVFKKFKVIQFAI